MCQNELLVSFVYQLLVVPFYYLSEKMKTPICKTSVIETVSEQLRSSFKTFCSNWK